MEAFGHALLFNVLRRRWHWVAFIGAFCAVAAVWAATRLWRPTYEATAKLLLLERADAEYFKTRGFTAPTIANLISSSELRQYAARKISAKTLAEQSAMTVTAKAIFESEVIHLNVVGPHREAVVEFANALAQAAEEYTKSLQATEASEALQTVSNKLSQLDGEIEKLQEQLRGLPRPNLQPLKERTPLQDELSKARTEYSVLLGQFTESHPAVQQARSRLEALEKAITAAATDPVPSTATHNESFGLVEKQLQDLNYQRLDMISRAREAEALLRNPVGYARVLALAERSDVGVNTPFLKLFFASVVGFLFGITGAFGSFAVAELREDRLKTAADVERVTNLPVVAVLGDLNQMTPDNQSQWAFQTWTALQNRMSVSPNHGFVCGITSSFSGAGRSTWLNLLAEAASKYGFRVLIVATPAEPAYTGEDPDSSDSRRHSRQTEPGEAGGNADQPCYALTAPSLIAQKLAGPGAGPILHIPLPGWVWNLERRKEWQAALRQWSTIDNVVILIELPPVSVAESVLLATNIPNVILLVDSGKVAASACREHVELLWNARCNLVGAVLNRASGVRAKPRFARWKASDRRG